MAADDAQGWPRVAVMGAGAVGSYFGGMLARAGARVVLIARAAHAEAVQRRGLLLDTLSFREHVKAEAATQAGAARGADVVLFAVKTPDTEEAARSLAPHLKPGAVVVDLQNGVDNIERIRRASGIEALAGVVYVAAAMPAPGWVKHSGRGDLVIGDERRAGEVARVAEMFARAGIKCRVTDNIEGELWAKLVWNCAGNAITALGRATYGQVAASGAAQEVLLAAARETMEVARAAGVRLPEMDLAGEGLNLARALGPATSSTAQDVARGKRTEIDSLNGYVAQRGAELGVTTPVNHTLWALVKLLEDNYNGSR